MKSAGEILDANHRQVLRLLDDLADPAARSGEVRAGLVEKVRRTLQEHAVIEEELVHPSLREAVGRAGDLDLLNLVTAVCRERRAAVQLVLRVLEQATRGPVAAGCAGADPAFPIACAADDAEAEMFEAARRVASRLEPATLRRPRALDDRSRR